MREATSGVPRTWPRSWATSTRSGMFSGAGAMRWSFCRSGWATSAGCPGPAGPTWSSTCARGSTATPASRISSSAPSSSPEFRLPDAGPGPPPSATGSTSPTRCSPPADFRSPRSPWPRPTRPRRTSRCRPSSSRRRKTPASESTTAPSAPPSGRSSVGWAQCWSSSKRCWSRNTCLAGSSTSASSASGCCRSPRSSSTTCPRATGRS